MSSSRPEESRSSSQRTPSQAVGPLPPWLRRRDGALQLSLRIQPRASRNQVQGEFGDQLRIRITAPPVDSAANQALVEFLAETLGCSRSQITLLRGHTARLKVLAVQGVTAEHVLARLQPLGT